MRLKKQIRRKKKIKMIAIIRISGLVNVSKEVQETLYRMRLRRKYACVLASETPEEIKKLKKIRSFVAYGKINEETIEKLIKFRGKAIDKKKTEALLDTKKTTEKIIKGESFESLGIKPFFRLHPPRKGINSKIHYPKGVLGDNKEDINKLIERML